MPPDSVVVSAAAKSRATTSDMRTGLVAAFGCCLPVSDLIVHGTVKLAINF
jgi:hypothetical protein